MYQFALIFTRLKNIMQFGGRYKKWMAVNYLKMMSLGPLSLRIVAGSVFLLHGIAKFQNISDTTRFFSEIGLPLELVIPIALLELVGGMMLLLGILTRITASLFVAEMAGSILAVKLSKGFFGGYEIDLLLLAIFVSLLLTGAGRISLEWKMGRGMIPNYNSGMDA